MLISLCTPCMNRVDDFVATLPLKIIGANICPPVEIVTIDYDSQDGLDNYMYDLMKNSHFDNGSFYTYRKYTGRDTYHAAHANNLAMLTGSGEYVVLVPADVYLERDYLVVLRDRIEKGCVWCNTDRKCRSTIAIKKDVFIEIGGYDERFEMYGPDDLDLIHRLERHGYKRGSIPNDLVHDVYTSPEKKIENYRIKGVSHKELGKMSMPYYYENEKNGSLVANVGIEWGKL